MCCFSVAATFASASVVLKLLSFAPWTDNQSARRLKSTGKQAEQSASEEFFVHVFCIMGVILHSPCLLPSMVPQFHGLLAFPPVQLPLWELLLLLLFSHEAHADVVSEFKIFFMTFTLTICSRCYRRVCTFNRNSLSVSILWHSRLPLHLCILSYSYSWPMLLIFSWLLKRY